MNVLTLNLKIFSSTVYDLRIYLLILLYIFKVFFSLTSSSRFRVAPDQSLSLSIEGLNSLSLIKDTFPLCVSS